MPPQTDPRMHEFVVVKFKCAEVSWPGAIEPEYRPTTAASDAMIVTATNSSDAIQRCATSPGFYDAFPLPSLDPQEYRLTVAHDERRVQHR